MPPVFPMVSILMPSLNQSRFLPAALDSVLHQSPRDLELIVADGGSTDETTAILEHYARADPRVKWASLPDSGPAEAVNRAASQAQGEIIGWLNADDLYNAGAVAEAVAVLECHPEQMLVYGHAEVIDEDGMVTGRYPTQPPSVGVKAFADGCFICQPTVFLRRTAWFSLGGLDTNLATAFDFDFWIRAFKQWPDRIGFVDRVQACSRRHAHTITSKRRKHVALEGVAVLRRQLRCAPPHWILTHLEEIMSGSPDGSHENLHTQVAKLLEEARGFLNPEDFTALAQHVADDRRLALAGANSFIEVYPDGWAGRVLQVRYHGAGSKGLKLVCRSGMPAGHRHRLQVNFPDGCSSHLTVRGEREFQLTLPAPPLTGHTHVVFSIESRDTFCPVERDLLSDDRRKLSFQVLTSVERQ